MPYNQTNPLRGTVTRLTTFETNIQSLAGDANLLAGACSEIVDLTALADFPMDVVFTARIFVNGSLGVTSARPITLYVIPQGVDNGGTPIWPVQSAAGGVQVAPGAVTFGFADDRHNAGEKLGHAMTSNSTANVPYTIKCRSLAQVLPFMPRRFMLFCSHNTGQPLKSSGHIIEWEPLYVSTTAK